MSALPPKTARGSLSGRLLCLTFAVVLLVQILFFVPEVIRERRSWLQERIAYGQLAAQSFDDAEQAVAGGQPPTERAPVMSAAAQADLLRLAGVEAVRIVQPDREAITVGSLPPDSAATAPDLRREVGLQAFRDTLDDLANGRDRLVLVQARGPVRPGTMVTVQYRSSALSAHLRAFARDIAGLGLLVAAITGLFIYLALRVLLVRPMRRLTDSIAAFRADPERTPPLDVDQVAKVPRDEVGQAADQLAQMQRELRAALWRYARLAALGTAVAKVSHDLRSMLAPALLSAERLQNNADPNVRRIGDTVVRAVERATELVRSGLEFAREGPITLARSRFPLRDAVGDAAEQVRASLPSLLVDNLVQAELEVDADREQVGRVLANLLRNAGEASATRIVVDAAVQPNKIEISSPTTVRACRSASRRRCLGRS